MQELGVLTIELNLLNYLSNYERQSSGQFDTGMLRGTEFQQLPLLCFLQYPVQVTLKINHK